MRDIRYHCLNNQPQLIRLREQSMNQNTNRPDQKDQYNTPNKKKGMIHRDQPGQTNPVKKS